MKRIITGLLLVGLIILNLVLLEKDPLFFALLISAMAVLGTYEITKALREDLPPCLRALALLYSLLLLPSYILGHSMEGVFLLTAVAIMAALVLSTFKAQVPISSVGSFALALCYPALLLSFIYPLAYSDRALFLLVCVFGIGPMSDTFAFLVGSLLKGPKLYSEISPKKTVSGAVGGLIGGLTAGMMIYSVFISFFSHINIPSLWQMEAIGIAGSVFTQLGDLAESAIKRKLGIKDFGNLLPGHGGVLDRVDGIIFNAIFIYTLFTYII
jgi:phosphatidate cytidylyltransferase